MTIIQIKITDIIISPDRRAVDQEKVEELAASIEKSEMFCPILVDQNNNLIAGGHRIEAHRLLGRTEITAIRFSGSPEELELISIDENLIRNELDRYDRGRLLVRRDEILLELGQRAKTGDNQFKGGTPDSGVPLKTTKDIANEIGISKSTLKEDKQIYRDLAPEVFQVLKDSKTPIEQALKVSRLDHAEQKKVADKIESGIKPTDAVKEYLRDKNKIELEKQVVDISQLAPMDRRYDVIVIDPPWEMEKIEREGSDQVGFDYPTMTVEQIKQFNLPATDSCHVFLWTTQKYLPYAFGIFNEWGVKYVCMFVWHKNGGYQPFGLPQNNAEFVLYGRIGTPVFVDLRQFFVCFNADRQGHSVKPDVFYDLVRRVTVGNRVDIFNRRKIEGFDTWGNKSNG